MQIPSGLLEAASERRIIPVVGAGISRRVTNHSSEPVFPSWSEFVSEVADEVGKQVPDDPLADLIRNSIRMDTDDNPQELWIILLKRAKNKITSGGWTKLLNRLFDKKRKDADLSSLQVHRLIWECTARHVLTTNYDQSLRWACPDEDSLRVLTASNKTELTAVHDLSSDRLSLIHLHGSITSHQTLVITDDDYNLAYSEDNAILFTLEKLLASHTFLFLGYGLKDVELTQLMKNTHKLFAGGTGPHFAVVSRKESRFVKGIGAGIMPVEVSDFEDSLLAILTQLADISKFRKVSDRSYVQDEQSPNTQSRKNSPKKEIQTPRDVYQEYMYSQMLERKRTRSTITSVERAIRRWEKFLESKSKSEAGAKKLDISEISKSVLLEFRRWLIRTGCSAKTAEITAHSLRSILLAAEEIGLVDAVPKLPRIQSESPIEKQGLKPDYVERMWNSIPILDWPKKMSGKQRAVWSIQDFWQAALIMYLTYGFDTQDLVVLESGFTAIKWKDLQLEEVTFGRRTWKYGAFWFVRQKTKRFRPDPIRIPLTKYAHFALRKLWHKNAKPTDHVFDVVRTALYFRENLEKLGDGRGRDRSERVKVKDLKNTAFMRLDSHFPGISRFVSGSASLQDWKMKIPNREGRLCSVPEALVDCFSTLDTYSFFEQVLPEDEATE